MPFKLTLDVMPETVEQREVEILDECPHCHRDLHESCALREVTFTSAACDCNLTGDESGIDYCGSMETYPEAEYTVDYECTACGKSVLAPAVAEHTKDANCVATLVDGTCSACGVLHGDPCPDCGGRGYHGKNCVSA
jgi:hypothetical protein